MSRLVIALGFFAVWLLVGCVAAFAQTTVAPVTTVPLAPWVGVLSAIATPIVMLLASAVAAWAVRVFSRWTHHSVTAQAQATFQQAAANGAGRILAAATGDISKMAVPVGSAVVAAEANNVATLIPDALNTLGVQSCER